MRDERPITLAQAARHHPDGTPPSTIVRHITKGVKAPVGVVRLEALRFGRRWTTSTEAIHRFREKCTIEVCGTPPPSPDRAAERAKAKAFLDAIGAK